MSWEMAVMRSVFILILMAASFHLRPFHLTGMNSILVGALLGFFFVLIREVASSDQFRPHGVEVIRPHPREVNFHGFVRTRNVTFGQDVVGVDRETERREIGDRRGLYSRNSADLGNHLPVKFPPLGAGIARRPGFVRRD